MLTKPIILPISMSICFLLPSTLDHRCRNAIEYRQGCFAIHSSRGSFQYCTALGMFLVPTTNLSTVPFSIPLTFSLGPNLFKSGTKKSATATSSVSPIMTFNHPCSKSSVQTFPPTTSHVLRSRTVHWASSCPFWS